MRRPPGAARRERGRPPRGRRRRVTSSRHGWPGDRARRAPGSRRRGRRRCSSSCGTRQGRQRTAGTVGANSETTGVPTAAARCAGPVLPTTTAARAGEHARRARRSVVAPPRSMRRGVARDARGERALPGAAGDDHVAARGRERVDERARGAPAPRRARAPTRPGGRRRSAPARRRAAPAAARTRSAPSSPARQREPGARGERQRRARPRARRRRSRWRTSSSEPG